jgi:hypothetical protein
MPRLRLSRLFGIPLLNALIVPQFRLKRAISASPQCLASDDDLFVLLRTFGFEEINIGNSFFVLFCTFKIRFETSIWNSFLNFSLGFLIMIAKSSKLPLISLTHSQILHTKPIAGLAILEHPPATSFSPQQAHVKWGFGGPGRKFGIK